MTSNPSDALLIFAKWPEPGKVKTRLSPPLSFQEAADLYRCMLQDTLAATAEISGIQRMIFFDGGTDSSEGFRLIAPNALIIRQKGDDLGERLANAFAEAFDAGCKRVAVIGSDSPHMPAERVSYAFHMLSKGKKDAVFGPSEDGGYYLLAMNNYYPELFRDIPWSSSEALERSLERAESTGLKTALLPTCFDLDTNEDLIRLHRNPSQSVSAPLTAAFLSGISAYFSTATS